MKEIEVKAKLKDREGVMRKLKELGCKFELPIRQEDTIFAKKEATAEEYIRGGLKLRIRVNNDKQAIFTAKISTEVKLAKIEYETEISKKEEMSQALGLMGFSKIVEVNKTRIITHYKGDEICIDEVEGLGNFIEMERLTEEGNAEKIQDELFKFLETLGVGRADRVFSGYDILMLERNEKN